MPSQNFLTRFQSSFFRSFSFVQRIDMFGAALPTFNIAGKTQVNTHFGGCTSLLILYVTFLFTTLKFQQMLDRKRPSIVTNVDENAFTDGQEYNTRDQNFMIAVGANNYITGEKNDPRYVKWVASLSKQTEEELIEENYELHPCTAEELDNF